LEFFEEKDTSLLRYQLIHAVAGTLIEAVNQEAIQAVFVIHEFVPRRGKSAKAMENDNDLKSFVNLLSGDDQETNRLIAPLFVPGGGKIPSDIPLYIGKIVSVISNE
jgi:hypothetical protein